MFIYIYISKYLNTYVYIYISVPVYLGITNASSKSTYIRGLLINFGVSQFLDKAARVCLHSDVCSRVGRRMCFNGLMFERFGLNLFGTTLVSSDIGRF